MAPGYRNPNRRQNRTGYVDHDVFEGLPVRQWRRDYMTVAPPPTQENATAQNDIWAVELSHGMPKDSHMLPQHSQDLLRAARSGRIYKRPPPAEEEEADPEATLGDRPEKKDDDTKDKGFTAKAWKQIPRHQEAPEFEFLAKRRKGLVTLSKVTTGPIMVKNKVRREDAAGNEDVEDVTAPKGAQVQGEIIAQTVVADPTVTDGFAHPTPPRRKGAPPKKKNKKPGPGRGKKKIVAPTSVPAPIDGVAQSVEATGGAAVKLEPSGNENGGLPTNNEDTEMGEGSMAVSDDEGEAGDHGDEDGGSVSAQDSPSKPSRPFSPVVSELPHMRENPGLGSPDAGMSGTDDLPGPPLPHLDTSEGKFGSPLKNVAMTTSNLRSPIIKSQAPSDSIPQSSLPEANIIEDTTGNPMLDDAMQQQVIEAAPPKLPSPPSEPDIAEAIASAELLQEEEEMLLDIVENTNNANISAPEPVASLPETSAEPIAQAQEPEIPIPEPQTVEPMELPIEEKADEPAAETEQPVEDDEPFADLLGSLERQVEEPQVQPAPVIEVKPEPASEITEFGESKTEEGGANAADA